MAPYIEQRCGLEFTPHGHVKEDSLLFLIQTEVVAPLVYFINHFIGKIIGCLGHVPHPSIEAFHLLEAVVGNHPGACCGEARPEDHIDTT